ncbi:MAG: efflux RND transporter periplasmic adaptor subunit [Candidatus Delongbacteria bacterium]|nr:efflux RND transporter periplasmic adaptor subunit [Candidatus Delongbacteria bacterium]
MKNKTYIILTVIIIAVITYLIMKPKAEDKDAKMKELKDQAKEVKSFVKVKTVKLAKQNLIMYINTTGTAKAERSVDIYPQVSGFVKKVYVSENSYVSKGDLIFTLDNEQYLLNLEREKDNLLKAKIAYGIRKNEIKDQSTTANDKKFDEAINKLNEQRRTGKISEKEFEDKKLELEVDLIFNQGGSVEVLKSSTGLTQAMISYKKAKLDYEYATVRAPSSGYVANLNLVEGQYLNTGSRSMTIVDYKMIEMEIPVLESEVGDLTDGRKVEVKFEALKDIVFNGTIETISPIIDQASGTCKILVNIPNDDLKIKSGMRGNVKIESKIYFDKIIVPNEAILTRDNRKLVFIVQDEKAKWIYVNTGLSNFNYTEIILDEKDPKLKLGDDVVVTNNYTLAHDADVKVIE